MWLRWSTALSATGFACSAALHAALKSTVARQIRDDLPIDSNGGNGLCRAPQDLRLLTAALVRHPNMGAYGPSPPSLRVLGRHPYDNKTEES